MVMVPVQQQGLLSWWQYLLIVEAETMGGMSETLVNDNTLIRQGPTRTTATAKTRDSEIEALVRTSNSWRR